MLERNVQINGKVYTSHELVRMNVIIGNTIIACVLNKADDEAIETYHNVQYQDGIEATEVETQLWALPEFEEYIDQTQAVLDEVLDILTDDQAIVVPDAFPAWKPNTEYKVGDRRKHEGILYKCLQAHTSQEDWTPDSAASLWARMLNPDPEVIPVWEQPDSTNPYMTGDKVHYPDADGPIYESVIDNNIWSPEAYPQGWQLVEGGE